VPPGKKNPNIEMEECRVSRARCATERDHCALRNADAKSISAETLETRPRERCAHLPIRKSF
jgi:hypothetical protein